MKYREDLLFLFYLINTSISRKLGITREEQDAYAVRSYQNAAKAYESGAITVKKKCHYRYFFIFIYNSGVKII